MCCDEREALVRGTAGWSLMGRGGHREELVERRALERIEEDGRGCRRSPWHAMMKEVVRMKEWMV